MTATLTTRQRKKLSRIHKRLWRDPEFRARMLAAMQSPAAMAKRKEGIKRTWGDPAFRAKHRAAMDRHHDPKRAERAERREREAAMAHRRARKWMANLAI